MSREPRAFVAVDLGTATVAVSLLGRVDGRWRLLGATQAPAAVGPDPLVERLRERVAAADPDLASSLGFEAPGGLDDAARVECRTTPPPVLAVVAATERVLGPAAAVAATAGWSVRPLAIEGAEIIGVIAALVDPGVTAILAVLSDPPGADERPLADELAAVVVAAVERRPELAAVLSGGLAEPGGRVEPRLAAGRPGSTILAPEVDAGDGAPLRDLLDSLRGGERDGRRGLARAAGTLAAVLDRRVEVLDIGSSAGTRMAASVPPGAEGATVAWATVAGAALVPPAVDDPAVDAVAGWLTIPLDRLRVRDRLRELVIAPWGDAAGDGALLRLAAARAAAVRLVEATPALDALPAPDLVVAAGGAWAVAPGPAVALALADVRRRPGVAVLGLDHARLLGPLGTIEDDDERRRVVADLRDELIAPLGTVIMPAGLRAGRSGGRLTVHAAGGPAELDLVPGGLELVDLPPGERASVELRFRDAVDLGVRARHFAVEVAGGLGGLLVDLRDVPLRMPERPERRRDLLAAWQGALWPGLEA